MINKDTLYEFQVAKLKGIEMAEILAEEYDGIFGFCNRKNYPLMTYSYGASIIKCLGFHEYRKDNYAFTVNASLPSDPGENQFYIFLNGEISTQRKKFVVAHELAHIMMDDVWRRSASIHNREPSRNDRTVENTANIYAAFAMDKQGILEYEVDMLYLQEICGISLKSAAYLKDLIDRVNKAKVLLEAITPKVIPLAF